MHKQQTNTMITIVFSRTESCLFNTENVAAMNLNESSTIGQ